MALFLDLWPAEVYTPGGDFYPETRVMVTRQGNAVVWHNWTGVAAPLFVARLADPLPDGPIPTRYGQPVLLSFAAGTMTVNKTGGCACANPIRNLDESDALTATAALPS